LARGERPVTDDAEDEKEIEVAIEMVAAVYEELREAGHVPGPDDAEVFQDCFVDRRVPSPKENIKACNSLWPTTRTQFLDR
jgi:hypothetical protein